MIRLLFLLLLPSVALAQFGAFERDFIVARSNLTASSGITLGGVLRTTWPSVGSDSLTNATGPGITVSGGIMTLSTNGWSFGGGTSDHSALSNILWTASGHTGTPARIAGFLEGGSPGYIVVGTGLQLDGSDNLVVTSSPYASTAGAGWPTNWPWASITGAPAFTTLGIVSNNFLNLSGGTLSGNLYIGGNFNVGGSFVVSGVTTQLQTFIVSTSTNIYTITTNNTTVTQLVGTNYVDVGTGTNYVTTIISTNVVNMGATTNYYQTIIQTNQLSPFINGATGTVYVAGDYYYVNTSLILTQSASVLSHHFKDYPFNASLIATGAWDWAGATWSNPPTNGWTFGTVGAVTNSASNVSGLTLTTANGITTLGGTLPSGMTTGQVQGIVGDMGLASTNVSQTAPSGTGSLIYSNSQFYFTPPSAAGLGSVTNVNITVNTSGGLTIDGGTSKVITNGGSYTLAQAPDGTMRAELDDLRYTLAVKSFSDYGYMVAQSIGTPFGYLSFFESINADVATTNGCFWFGRLWLVGGTSGDLVQWTAVANLPAARSELGVGVLNGSLYAIGGYNGSAKADVYRYSDTSNTWTAVASLPAARHGIAAGVLNGSLYAIGGYNVSAKADVYRYSDTSNTWTAVASLPAARAWTSAGVLNGSLYAIGGWDGNDKSDVYRYSDTSNTWTAVASLPAVRAELGVGVLNGSLYAIGGDNGSAKADVYRYSDTSNTWTAVASLPAARYYLAAGVLNGSLYAIGGTDGSVARAEVYKTLPQAGNGGTLTSLPYPVNVTTNFNRLQTVFWVDSVSKSDVTGTNWTAATYNTDWWTEVSLDGGTNWTRITNATVGNTYLATNVYSALVTNGISGTNLVQKIVAGTGTVVRVRGWQRFGGTE